MLVIVTKNVVDAIAQTEDARKLHSLLNHACDGRHTIVFDPPTAVDSWLDQIDSGSCAAYGRAIQLAARSAATLSADSATIRIEIVDQPQWEDPLAILPLDDALAVLQQPLGIVVENAVNDWNFLCGVMRISEREQIRNAEGKGWVKCLHGGGSDLVNQLNIRLSSPQEWLRTFVMFDSDRRHPDELVTTWEPTGSEACQGFNVEKFVRQHLPCRYWMLKRRFIESYMPKSAMIASRLQTVSIDKIEAFFRMEKYARWYFNMKNGFKGDEPIQNKNRCGNLYDNVNDNDRQTLHEGFGGNMANQFAQALSEEFDWDSETRQETANALPRLMRLL